VWTKEDRMRLVAYLRVFAVMLAGLIVLSACTVVVDDDAGPGPRPGPGYCSREYVPVCARRSSERRTFANACLADRAGYDIIRRGECRQQGGGGDQPRFCTKEYRPVCARRSGDHRTFGNSCEADAAGWRVVGNGPC
jgi:hypothetical protein